MKMRWLTSMVIIFVISVIGAGLFAAREDDDDKRQFPKNATFTTLITTPRPIEGLTGDNHRNLIHRRLGHASLSHLADQSKQPCPNSGRVRFPGHGKLRLLWYRFR